jgi:hypothetical protein
VDDLIEMADCARAALQEKPFLRSVEDWREGALLVQKHSKIWTRASLCEKFAYYDFALRRKKDVNSCTYTSDPKNKTGAVLIPNAYIVRDGGCSALGGVIDGIASIKMSRDESGAVYCNGAEMRSTSMVPDDKATVMSKIRAKFILGVSDSTINIKRAKIEEELGAKFLVEQRSESQERVCDRKLKASIVIWPDIKDKLACTYQSASDGLKAEVDKLKTPKKTLLGGTPELDRLVQKVAPAAYVLAGASDLVSSGTSALRSGASAAYAAGASALGLVSGAK